MPTSIPVSRTRVSEQTRSPNQVFLFRLAAAPTTSNPQYIRTFALFFLESAHRPVKMVVASSSQYRHIADPS
jgi:hypothetical protein